MTTKAYLWGWFAYLLGSVGVLFVLWYITRPLRGWLRLPLRAAELEARIAQGLARLAPARAKIAEIAGGIIARLNLTPAETKVLRILASRQGQIVTRDELSRHLYGTPWTYGDRRFDVHVTKIRRKLRDEAGGMLRLRTVRAEGYTLEYAAAESAVTS